MPNPFSLFTSRLTGNLFAGEIRRQVNLAAAALDDARDRQLRPLFANLPLSNTRDRSDG